MFSVSSSLVSSLLSGLPDFGLSLEDLTTFIIQLAQQLPDHASESDQKQYFIDHLNEFLGPSEAENFAENLLARLMMENQEEENQQEEKHQFHEQFIAEGEGEEEPVEEAPAAVLSDDDENDRSFKRKREFPSSEAPEATEPKRWKEENSRRREEGKGRNDRPQQGGRNPGYVQNSYSQPAQNRPPPRGFPQATMQLASGLVVPAPPMPPGHVQPHWPPHFPPMGMPQFLPPHFPGAGGSFPPFPQFQQPQALQQAKQQNFQQTTQNQETANVETSGRPQPQAEAENPPASVPSVPLASPRLFVSQIPASLNSLPTLSAHFQRFGTIRSIQIMGSDKALVEFAEKSEAQLALQSSDAVLGNRFIQVKPFRGETAGGNRRAPQARQHTNARAPPPAEAKKSAFEVAEALRAAKALRQQALEAAENSDSANAPAENENPQQQPPATESPSNASQSDAAKKLALLKAELESKKKKLEALSQAKKPSAPPVISAAQRAAEILAAKHAEKARQLKEELARLQARKAEKVEESH